MLKIASIEKCDGFTFVEILIAMAVASVGLICLALSQTTAIKGNTISGKFTQATFLAAHILERIKDGHMVREGTFGYIKLSSAESGVIRDTGVIIGVKHSGAIGGPFNVRWQVVNQTEWSRRVTVTVSWKNILGHTRYLSLESVSRGKGA